MIPTVEITATGARVHWMARVWVFTHEPDARHFAKLLGAWKWKNTL